MQSTTRGGVTEFVHQLGWDDIPSDVQEMATRCLLDLAGTLVAGSGTELSQIVRDAATAIYGGDEATLLLDGRRASAPGAVWANASRLTPDTHRWLSPGQRPRGGQRLSGGAGSRRELRLGWPAVLGRAGHGL